MRRRHGHAADQADIDMTPMLDVVFIMLIFFIVTTSFVKESSLDVNRPSNKPNEVKTESQVVLISVDATGTVKVDNRQVDIDSVEANVQSALAGKPDASVVVLISKDAGTGSLVKVLDQARSAGAKNLSIAQAAE